MTLLIPTVSSTAAAAKPRRRYHTVPQALELSTLWQPRYSSRKASLCGPLLYVCVGIAYACVMCVLRYVNMCHVLLLTAVLRNVKYYLVRVPQTNIRKRLRKNYVQAKNKNSAQNKPVIAVLAGVGSD